MSEELSQPNPSLNPRELEQMQVEAGNFTAPNVHTTEAPAGPVMPAVVESPQTEQEPNQSGILKRISTRVRDITDVFRSAPESARLRWQFRRHIGAVAVLSLYSVHEYVEKLGAPGVADKATLTAGLYMLGGAAAYKTYKYGSPGSEKNRRNTSRAAHERQEENRQWDENLAILRSSREL